MHANVKVLVVDDDTRFRDNAVRLLAAEGFTVFGVADGLEALELLQNNDYDVVVMDQRMPELSGVETLRALRMGGCKAEVIILTGHASVDDAVEGMNLGAAEYLLKPATTKRLVEKIMTAYERKQEKMRKFGA